MSTPAKKCPLCGFPLDAIVRVCVGPHPTATIVPFPKSPSPCTPRPPANPPR